MLSAGVCVCSLGEREGERGKKGGGDSKRGGREGGREREGRKEGRRERGVVCCVQVFVELEELKTDGESLEWEETAR